MVLMRTLPAAWCLEVVKDIKLMEPVLTMTAEALQVRGQLDDWRSWNDADDAVHLQGVWMCLCIRKQNV